MICSETPVNHAVVIVGWGRDKLDQEYFIIKNHFGTHWGEAGYAKISTEVSEEVPQGTCNIYSGIFCLIP